MCMHNWFEWSCDMEDCIWFGYLIMNINDVGHVVILCKIVGHVTCMMFSIGNASFAQKGFNVHIFLGRHTELQKQ